MIADRLARRPREAADRRDAGDTTVLLYDPTVAASTRTQHERLLTRSPPTSWCVEPDLRSRSHDSRPASRRPGSADGTLHGRLRRCHAVAEGRERSSASGIGYRIARHDGAASTGCFAERRRRLLARAAATRRHDAHRARLDERAHQRARSPSEGNAALALNLLGAHRTLIWYLPTLDDLASGEPPTIAELTPPLGHARSLLLLVLVALAAAFWRGRRFGPLVVENLPVVVRASETMEGRARLYERQPPGCTPSTPCASAPSTGSPALCGLPRTATVDRGGRRGRRAHRTRPRRGRRACWSTPSPRTDGELVRLSDELLALEARRGAHPSRRIRPTSPHPRPTQTGTDPQTWTPMADSCRAPRLVRARAHRGRQGRRRPGRRRHRPASSRCSPAATCCSRACPASRRRCWCARLSRALQPRDQARAVHPRPDAGRRHRLARLRRRSRASSSSARARCSPTSCSPTRSTARPRRPSRRCSRRWRSARSRVDGVTRPLPVPFMVAATKNPIEYEGTYTLPEAQLDRFLLKLVLDLPGARQRGRGARAGTPPASTRATSPPPASTPVLDAATLAAAQADVATRRRQPGCARPTPSTWPAPPGRARRSSSASARAARRRCSPPRKAWAWLTGFDAITPDHVQAMALPVLRHRIQLRPEAELEGVSRRRDPALDPAAGAGADLDGAMAVSGWFVALLALGVVPIVLLGGLARRSCSAGWLLVAAARRRSTSLLAGSPRALRLARDVPGAGAARRDASRADAARHQHRAPHACAACVRDAWQPSAGARPTRAARRAPAPASAARSRPTLTPFRRGERRAAHVTVRSFGPLRPRGPAGDASRRRAPSGCCRRSTRASTCRRGSPGCASSTGARACMVRGQGTEFD